jgi:formylglycine-generating enzyme required for sulfatase activity
MPAPWISRFPKEPAVILLLAPLLFIQGGPFCRAAEADATLIEIAFWNSIKDSRDPAEFEAYLKKYPNGEFAVLARNRRDALVLKALPPGTVFRDCPDCPEMVVIPAGSFMMGSPESETTREGVLDQFAECERPQHRVTIGYSLALGKYDVTFAEWGACVADGGCDGYRPADKGWGRGNRPVINVSWEDAESYIAWLNRKVPASPVTVSTGGGEGPYRLPSEAEWEYAARAGAVTARYWGEAVGSGHANCQGCGSRWDNRQTAPVGSFPANGFSLYDMLGNVWQWTADCWNETYNGAPDNGQAWNSGDCTLRALRGASFGYDPRDLRAADRLMPAAGLRHDDFGFRVARTISP